MNRIFKTVFSKVKGMCIVVGEHARPQGKSRNLKAVVASVMVAGALGMAGNAVADNSNIVNGTGTGSIESIGAKHQENEQWVGGATGNYATALGYNTTASGSNSTAMGNATVAAGDNSTVAGNQSKAYGASSFAVGQNVVSGKLKSGYGYLNGVFYNTSNESSGPKDGYIEVSDGTGSVTKYYAVVPQTDAVDGSVTATVAMGYNTTASGDSSTAMGSRTTASGTDSTAMGYSTTASALGATAMGYNTTASGQASTAMGDSTAAVGTSSTAMGYNTKAYGHYSTAMGYTTKASGEYATAMGDYTTASGQASTAMGHATVAAGDNSTAAGYQSKAYGNNSFAVGQGVVSGKLQEGFAYSDDYHAFYNTTDVGAEALNLDGSLKEGFIKDSAIGAYYRIVDSADAVDTTVSNTVAMGNDTTASGLASTAMGSGTTASGTASTATGQQTVASGANSFTAGYQSQAYGTNAIAMGNGAVSGVKELNSGFDKTADGTYYHSEQVVDSSEATITVNDQVYQKTGYVKVGENYYKVASYQEAEKAYDTVAIGNGAKATANNAVALGNHTTASGDSSTAMGYNTTASGANSTAMGSGTTASGSYSTAMGVATMASGSYSTTMGYYTQANDANSTAIGYYSQANGMNSTAMGDNTTASGYASTAIGYHTTANGQYATTMGYYTTANGRSTTAMGYNSIASGDYSTAIGRGAVAGVSALNKGYAESAGVFYSTTPATDQEAAARDGTGTYVNIGGTWYEKASATVAVKASVSDAVAIGHEAHATANNAVAIGNQTTASGNSATAMGDATKASGFYSTAMGWYTTASGGSSTAMGQRTEANGYYSTAMGFQTKANGTASTAMGKNSEASGANSLAAGNGAKATATDTVALGRNAQATVADGIALGSNAVANTEAGQVGYGAKGRTGASWVSTDAAMAIGSSTHTRQITGLAAGTQDSDAVNVAQLKAVDQRVDQNSSSINNLYRKTRKLDTRINRVGAHAAAIAALHPLDYDEDHKLTAAAGVGAYHGSNAVAAGVFYRPNENMMFSLGGSVNEEDTMVNAGFSYRFGTGSNGAYNSSNLRRQVTDLSDENRMLTAKLSSTETKLASADAKLAASDARIQRLEEQILQIQKALKLKKK